MTGMIHLLHLVPNCKGKDNCIQLTGSTIMRKGHVIEAEDLHQGRQVWLLDGQVPCCVIFTYIEIHDCDLDSPIPSVALLYMPMNMNWANVTSAIDQRRSYIIWVSRWLPYHWWCLANSA